MSNLITYWSTMVTVEIGLAMSNWRTAEIAHALIRSSKSISLGPQSFGALKRCLILSGVHQQIFGLWELRQGSPSRHTARRVPSTDSEKLISLIWGENWHIFKPSNIDPKDSAYSIEVLRRQDECFGPFPLSYTSLADDDRLDTLTVITESVKKRTAFAMASSREIAKEDRAFTSKLMQPDPRDRPPAKVLLQDAWLTGCTADSA